MSETTTIHHTEPAAGSRLESLRRRWPAVAGIALAGAMAYGLTGGAEVAYILAASAFVYLGAAALQRRTAAWPVFFVSFVVLTIAKVVGGAFDPTSVLLVLGAVLVGYGLVRGAARPSSGLPRQTAAMLVAGGAALAAPLLVPDLAGYVVAAGLLAHAAWDLHHHRTGTVVSASMAEFCLVLDTVLAVAILAVTLLG